MNFAHVKNLHKWGENEKTNIYSLFYHHRKYYICLCLFYLCKDIFDITYMKLLLGKSQNFLQD